jgi:hypothetical protein
MGLIPYLVHYLLNLIIMLFIFFIYLQTHLPFFWSFFGILFCRFLLFLYLSNGLYSFFFPLVLEHKAILGPLIRDVLTVILVSVLGGLAG